MIFRPVTATVFIAFLSLFQSFRSFAQDTVGIGYNDVLKTALSQNTAVVLARIDEDIARQNYRQTNAIFYPQANVSYSAIVGNDPLGVFAFKLQQQVVSPSDFAPSSLNFPEPATNFSARLAVNQPLFNLDMLYMRQGAYMQQQMYAYKQQRTADYLRLQVQHAYLQLEMAWSAVALAEEAASSVDTIYRLVQDRFDQGFIQKADLLNVQVQVKAAATAVATAHSSVRNASDFIALLMNSTPGHVYRPSAYTVDDVTGTSVPVGRADFLAMESGIRAMHAMVNSDKAALVPRINGFYTLQLNDRDALKLRGNGYMAGVQLSWDIFKILPQHQLIRAHKLEMDKVTIQLGQQKKQADADLLLARRQLIDAGFRYSQQALAVEQATEALRILQDRYTQGLVSTSDLLMARTQLSMQKLSMAQATLEQQLARASILFISSENK